MESTKFKNGVYKIQEWSLQNSRMESTKFKNGVYKIQEWSLQNSRMESRLKTQYFPLNRPLIYTDAKQGFASQGKPACQVNEENIQSGEGLTTDSDACPFFANL
ncbi:hypothetical protein ACF0H5_018884 [Mactra antiquata]